MRSVLAEQSSSSVEAGARSRLSRRRRWITWEGREGERGGGERGEGGRSQCTAMSNISFGLLMTVHVHVHTVHVIVYKCNI